MESKLQHPTRRVLGTLKYAPVCGYENCPKMFRCQLAIDLVAYIKSFLPFSNVLTISKLLISISWVCCWREWCGLWKGWNRLLFNELQAGWMECSLSTHFQTFSCVRMEWTERLKITVPGYIFVLNYKVWMQQINLAHAVTVSFILLMIR